MNLILDPHPTHSMTIQNTHTKNVYTSTWTFKEFIKRKMSDGWGFACDLSLFLEYQKFEEEQMILRHFFHHYTYEIALFKLSVGGVGFADVKFCIHPLSCGKTPPYGGVENLRSLRGEQNICCHKT